MSKVINQYGKEIDLEVAISLMDPFIRETVRQHNFPCSDQTFFNNYCAAHEKRYGPDDYQPAQKY